MKRRKKIIIPVVFAAILHTTISESSGNPPEPSRKSLTQKAPLLSLDRTMDNVLILSRECMDSTKKKVTLEGQVVDIRTKPGTLVIGSKDSGISRICICDQWLGLGEAAEHVDKIIWVRITGYLVEDPSHSYDFLLQDGLINGYELSSPEAIKNRLSAREKLLPPRSKPH